MNNLSIFLIVILGTLIMAVTMYSISPGSFNLVPLFIYH